jgi:hypothetical protein
MPKQVLTKADASLSNSGVRLVVQGEANEEDPAFLSRRGSPVVEGLIVANKTDSSCLIKLETMSFNNGVSGHHRAESE